MESLFVTTLRDPALLLQDVTPRVGTLLSLRMVIRALPLLSVYSEGVNKANFEIQPFSFWAAWNRARHIDSLLEIAQALKELMQGNIEFTEGFDELAGRVKDLTIESEDALYKNLGGAIVFKSIARKNAFCSLHRFIDHLISSFMWLVLRSIDGCVFVDTQQLDENREKLAGEKASLIESVLVLESQLSNGDVQKILKEYRTNLCIKIGDDATHSLRRLALFSEMLADIPDSDCARFAAQIPALEFAFKNIVLACESGDAFLIKQAGENLTIPLESYETFRATMTLRGKGPCADLYIEYSDALQEVFLKSFERNFVEDFEYQTDRLYKNIALHLKSNFEFSATDNYASLAEFISACEEIYRLDIGMAVNEVAYKAECVLDLLRRTSENRLMKWIYLDTAEWHLENSSWMQRLFQLLDADISDYSEHDLRAYRDLLYSQLEFDLQRERNGDDLLAAPIWAVAECVESQADWFNLTKTFRNDVNLYCRDLSHFDEIFAPENYGI